MLLKDILTEKTTKKPKPLKAGDETPHDYNHPWVMLNHLKQQALKNGQQLATTYQLFVPRRNPTALTARDRRLSNIANPYAHDDQGNLKPEYAKWEQPTTEAAPILKPGKAISPPGRNKPQADLWTSTARKTPNGWTSSWSRWIATNRRDWMSPTGYLYKVNPGALILELNGNDDAEQVFDIFDGLGRIEHNQAPDNTYDRDRLLHRSFPWNETVKHFDGVWHQGYNYDREGFMYGWDVESVAWFDTSFLTLVGEVPIANVADDS